MTGTNTQPRPAGMSLTEEIEYWLVQSYTVPSRDFALLCWGIHAGLRIAKAEHGARGQSGDEEKK